MTSHPHYCEHCRNRWDCHGKPGPVCTDVTCPICGFDENEPVRAPLTPEGPSMIMLCGWCDGARERHAAAHAMGRVVTTGICPACEPKFLAEGRF